MCAKTQKNYGFIKENAVLNDTYRKKYWKSVIFAHIQQKIRMFMLSIGFCSDIMYLTEFYRGLLLFAVICLLR